MSRKNHVRSVYFRDETLWGKIEKVAKMQNRTSNNFVETMIGPIAEAIIRDARKK
jgi:hypothetical protein